jgi:hypothetical protein
MSESIVATNTPCFKDLTLDEIRRTKEFLDPCGMEATDDIIDRLVGEQVDRLTPLLLAAFRRGDIGGSDTPLRLATACSGTDAPALALQIVTEQMEKRGMGDVFHFAHQFSCENEPFKQAYLVRNFDSLLFPDIARLADDRPRDVFGREQTLPPFNLFVAGTSCKNFSALRAKRRLSIEEKGCSGETFLAAVEVLLKERPPMAILENVIGAPWEKMSSYITGRVRLSDVGTNPNKKVKDLKSNARGKEVTFVYDATTDEIVVEENPGVDGIRVGSVVAGYLSGTSTKVTPIQWTNGLGKAFTMSKLIASNQLNKATDTLVFDTGCTYCTQTVKVDTKNFGLPQTRLRTVSQYWQHG